MIFKLPTRTMQSGHYRGRHQRVAGKVAVAHSGAHTFPLVPALRISSISVAAADKGAMALFQIKPIGSSVPAKGNCSGDTTPCRSSV